MLIVLSFAGIAEAQDKPNNVVLTLPKAVDFTSWKLDSWRLWSFDYEELKVRTVSLLKDGDTENNKDLNVNSGSLYKDLEVTDFYITCGGNENGANRIFCASVVPAGIEGPSPVLFVFHGGGGHASAALALGIARKNPGFAVVAVDYNGQFFPTEDPVTQWVTLTKKIRERRHDLKPNPLNFTMYHNVQAARRVMDWVEEQHWADKEKLGAVGISNGGLLSFMLAGVDNRIASVYTHVSSAGTEGMRGRACQPHDWLPAEQVEIWMNYVDPIKYIQTTSASVFMRIASNDRFFWLDGAANHRALLSQKAQWLITPNSDHGVGGPALPDPQRLWHRMVYFNEIPFPSFGEMEFSDSGNIFSVRIKSQRPLNSVHLAWSPGNEVSPARYWRWIKATEINGLWSASLPAGYEKLEGTLYFTATDVDGRTVSSDLVKKPGTTISHSLIWQNGCLWDIEKGADAWRSDLSFDRSHFENADAGHVRIVPVKDGRKAVFFTNSFILPTSNMNLNKGIRVEINGNGVVSKARVILARDLLSLDEQRYAAEIEISSENATVELLWEQFKAYGKGASDKHIFPVNCFAIEVENMPVTGITVGAVNMLYKQ